MPSKTVTSFLFILIVVVSYTVVRDSRDISRFYGSDLRNRVVGARMIRDGRSPYFYKWKAADGVRYYDPDNDPPAWSDMKLSVVSATPFFHHLLAPLTEWPQMRIFKLWMVLEYLALAGMAAFFFRRARTDAQHVAVVLAVIMFLFTEAWRMHLIYGQYYLFIPFLVLVFYWLVHHHKSMAAAAGAGLTAICLILIRPNCLLIFLPFLLLYRRYSRAYLMVAAIPVLLLAAWTVLDANELGLWKDYRKAVMEHTALHLRYQPYVPSVYPLSYNSWEDVGEEQVISRMAPMPNNENGNFFLLAKRIHIAPLGLLTLQGLSLAIIAGLCWIFFLRNRTAGNASLSEVALLGYCLYMVSDLFSPVYRWQYYTMQWFFPVLLAASGFERREWRLYGLLFAGLALNVINIGRFHFEHSIGEYLLLAALAGLAVSRKTAPGRAI